MLKNNSSTMASYKSIKEKMAEVEADSKVKAKAEGGSRSENVNYSELYRLEDFDKICSRWRF